MQTAQILLSWEKSSVSAAFSIFTNVQIFSKTPDETDLRWPYFQER